MLDVRNQVYTHPMMSAGHPGIFAEISDRHWHRCIMVAGIAFTKCSKDLDEDSNSGKAVKVFILFSELFGRVLIISGQTNLHDNL